MPVTFCPSEVCSSIKKLKENQHDFYYNPDGSYTPVESFIEQLSEQAHGKYVVEEYVKKFGPAILYAKDPLQPHISMEKIASWEENNKAVLEIKRYKAVVEELKKDPLLYQFLCQSVSNQYLCGMRG